MKATDKLAYLFVALCACIGLVIYVAPAFGQAPAPCSARFQLVAVSNDTTAQVYRLDTFTGETDRLITQSFRREADGAEMDLIGWRPVRSLVEEANANAKP